MTEKRKWNSTAEKHRYDSQYDFFLIASVNCMGYMLNCFSLISGTSFGTQLLGNSVERTLWMLRDSYNPMNSILKVEKYGKDTRICPSFGSICA